MTFIRTSHFACTFLILAGVVFLTSPSCGVASGYAPSGTPANQLSPSPASNGRICTSADIPRFQLAPLTKKEREARLRFFLGTTPVKSVPASPGVANSTCVDLLRHLKSFTNVTILTPIISAPTPAIAFDSRRKCGDPPLTVQDVDKTIAPACPTLDLDTEYFAPSLSSPKDKGSGKMVTTDKAFLQMSRADKEALSSFFVRASANFEYYDLSHYLGPHTWGYFAEGARHYNKPTEPPDVYQCLIQSDASQQYWYIATVQHWFETISKVFNANTCEIAIDHSAKANRRKNTDPDLSFFAFVDISGHLYRLQFLSDMLAGSYSDIVLPERRRFDILLDRIEVEGDRMKLKTACSIGIDKLTIRRGQ